MGIIKNIFQPISELTFPKTTAFIGSTWKRILLIKRSCDILSLSFKLSYILYLIYALVEGVGSLFVNIAFLVFSTTYFIFEICVKFFKKNTEKAKVKSAKRWFRYGRIAIKAIKLSMAIYGIYTSLDSPSILGIVLALFSAVIFFVEVLLEVIYLVASKMLQKFKRSVSDDINIIKRMKKEENASS